VAPLPAHLLETLPPNDWQKSSFAAKPVGSGPYKWMRSVPGEFVELEAYDRFFLGKPAIQHVVMRLASDPQARLNLFLSHEADAMDNVLPPLANIQRMGADKDVRLIPVPSSTVGYLLFNQRDPADTSRPHPILTDPDVRRAIIRALDRGLLVQAVYGSYGAVPYGPASSILWISHGSSRPSGPDPARARQLLTSRGWKDSDGDGVLEKDGRPLQLELSYPGTSPARTQMALLAQQQLRQVGISVVLRQFTYPIYLERRDAGRFDIDFSSSIQDPSPSTISQGWTCRGGTNRAHYCNPKVDSLINRAITRSGGGAEAWQAALRQIEDDAPAAFMYTPSYVYGVNRRFENVSIRPESSWMQLWKWTAKGASARRAAGN
jgi:peptide/nickel transport system substrate-binding protein